jgi:hypothetical protein
MKMWRWFRPSNDEPFITLEDTNAGAKRGYLQSSDGNLNFIPDSFHAQNSAAMVIENGSGTVKVPGTLRANQFEGSGAGITDIPAANITGKLSPTQLPPGSQGSSEISASNISGVLTPTQLPQISEIRGQVTLDQIPTLPPSKISGGLLSQPVGPGGRPLLAAGTLNPGSTQNVYTIPMTRLVSGPYMGPYSIEIYTTYLWLFWVETDGGGLDIVNYNVVTRTVLTGMVSVIGDNPLKIEPLNLGPTQTNYPDPKFPAVSCSIVGGTEQASVQLQTTAGEQSVPAPFGQDAPVLQYYLYSLM